MCDDGVCGVCARSTFRTNKIMRRYGSWNKEGHATFRTNIKNNETKNATLFVYSTGDVFFAPDSMALIYIVAHGRIRNQSN